MSGWSSVRETLALVPPGKTQDARPLDHLGTESGIRRGGWLASAAEVSTPDGARKTINTSWQETSHF